MRKGDRKLFWGVLGIMIIVLIVFLIVYYSGGKEELNAQDFCGKENVASVYSCGPYVRVDSSLLGGGSTYYEEGKDPIQCPVVGPDSVSDECKTFALLKCMWNKVC